MDSTSAPLADYFWIAGIDSLSYGPEAFSSAFNGDRSPLITPVDATIEELHEGEGPGSPAGQSPYATPRMLARHSRSNSWNRLSKLPSAVDIRRTSVSTITDDHDEPDSNRSSVTIKAGSRPGTNGESRGSVAGFSDFDFDKALLKFAEDRESFLDENRHIAGALVQQRPPMTNPRTERLRFEEDGELVNSANGHMNGISSPRRTPMRSVGGSIRRKISFRDMNSVKRQPTTVQRSGK